MTLPLDNVTLPPAPARLYLVGIGGIGMSGLAQYLQARGYTVAGSDRLLEGPGRSDLMTRLRAGGIPVFPQDGSGPPTMRPDAFIVSAAVEAGNADLESLPGPPVIHRAKALATLLDHEPGCQIAVAGSAGKTSVTGWIGSTLRHLGHRVLTVNGGFMRAAESASAPGNFLADPEPEFLVVEVDESDRSLTAFNPHVGVLLNIGTDHYGRDELTHVFGRFLDQCRTACVLHADLAAVFAGHGPSRRVLFADHGDGPAIGPRDYAARRDGIRFRLEGVGEVRCSQFGRHSATNAAAVAATLQAVDCRHPGDKVAAALGSFAGIRQRFEHMGLFEGGVPIFHDYAHNVEKIAAAIATAKEAAGTPLCVLFQPHGHGPLGFMRRDLGSVLASALSGGDRFGLLPVYYAGGTSSFSPTSDEVAAEYALAGLPVSAVTRAGAAAFVRSVSGLRAVLVLGARDPSLPNFASTLAAPPSAPQHP